MDGNSPYRNYIIDTEQNMKCDKKVMTLYADADRAWEGKHSLHEQVEAARKGAIFDFDGTLFDSMAIWDTAGEDYLRARGYEPRQGLREALSSMSLHQGAAYMKKEYGLPLSVETIMDGVNKTVEDFYFHTALPKPGVPGFLEALRQQGVKMVIATATDRYQIAAALERCGLAGYFGEIFTCTAIGHGKDEPDIYEAALAFLGTDKAETVVFEDALHAARTAKAAGFPVAAVFDAHEPGQAALRSLADFYLEHF